MKSIHYGLLIGFLGVCTVVPSGSVRAQDPAEKGTEFDAKYAIIFERNIFSRDRQPYRAPDEVAPPSAPPAPPIEANYVLRGISKELTKTIAFVEQADLGLIEKYEVGSHIARGYIASLTLDGLTYAVPADPNAQGVSGEPKGVNVTQVRIGQSLLGQAAQQEGGFQIRRNRGDQRARQSEQPSESTDQVPSLDGADPSEILRQLMERRRRELEN